MDADGGGGSGVRLLRFEICDCDARDDGRGDGEGGARPTPPTPPPWRPTPRLLPVGVIRQLLREDNHSARRKYEAQEIKSCTKITFPGCVTLAEKVAFCLPTAGRRA